MSLILDGSAGVTFPSGSNPQAAPSKVLQVVNASYNTYVSSSTSAYSDTGLTATITPLFSNSKILVLVDMAGCSKNASNTSLQLKLVRNSTALYQFEDFATYTNSSSQNAIGSCSTTYLDSPATTSATTYKVQLASSENSSNVGVQNNLVGLSTSTITIMEIAA
jgi:hypothetical protein